MTGPREHELEATIRRMEAAQRTIEQRPRDEADLAGAYEQLDHAIRDYEAAIPKWREAQAQRKDSGMNGTVGARG